MNRIVPLIVVCVLAACIFSRAATPSHKPPSAIRLAQPWNRLNDLTDDQRIQLDKIHRKSREEIKVIEQRAKAEMMAVLTPEQQAELREIEDQDSADKKLKAAEKDHAEPTSLPAQTP